MFLTGKKANVHPLKKVTIFKDMRGRIDKYCAEHAEKIQSILDEGGATAAPTDAANAYQSLIVGGSRKAIRPDGKRPHKKRPLSNMLPSTDIIDMTMGGKPWFPLCKIANASKNVSVEATAENFKALFEIVNEQLACEAPVARTPARKLRRRKSDSQAPTDSPGSRIYFFKGKGFFQRNSQAEVSTFGSGSSQRYVDKRRYLKVDPPLSGERATAAKAKGKSHKQRGGKCKTISRVLSHDDGDLSHEDPFANDD